MSNSKGLQEVVQPPPTQTPASTKTWEQVRAEPGLRGLSIKMHGFGEVTSKPWAKDAMRPEHWERIVSIAETSSKDFSFHPDRGFSWVSIVVINDQIIHLLPPAHLAEHI